MKKKEVLELKEIIETEDCFYLVLKFNFSSVNDCLELIKEKKFKLTTPTRSVFDSVDFVLSPPGDVNIVILKNISKMTIKEALCEGKKRGFKIPKPDTAILLREKLTNEDLKALELRWGLVVMHKKIRDSWNRMCFFHITTYEHAEHISLLPDVSNKRWSIIDGFVFCV
jgi:hypothetical protein